MKIRRYFFFGIIVFVTLVVLSLLSWLPSAVQREGIRRYRSIEDVKAVLKIKKIFLPAYFPQYLIWPPSEIYAARKPHTIVLMHFTNFKKTDTVLSIRQTELSYKSPLKSRIEPVTIKKREEVVIKGRKGLLAVALCHGGEPCNSVSWQEDGYNVEIVAKDSVEELLKIAESTASD
ncbi:MAG: hypothetical protein M0Z60_02330 [Nitrospiraceae bacterium]|nr:hypothetical protein [Nitrospiraceae bacterium]